MKKVISILIAVLLVFVSGCSSHPLHNNSNINNSQFNYDNSNLPLGSGLSNDSYDSTSGNNLNSGSSHEEESQDNSPSIPDITVSQLPLSGESQPTSSYESNSFGSSFSNNLDDSFEYPLVYPHNLLYSPVNIQKTDAFLSLTQKQKDIFHIIDCAAADMKSGYVELGLCSVEDIYVAYFALRNSRPEYFWLPNRFEIKVVGSIYSIMLSSSGGYEFSPEQVRSMTSQIKTVLAELNQSMSASPLTEYERELFIHNWLISRVTYDHDAAAGNSSGSNAWSAYGALVEGKAVCEGYARALSLLFNMCGIQNRCITGVTTGDHMWNLVKIEGEWYHLDATGNDSGDSNYYTYFNLSDKTIGLTHLIDTPFYDSYNYNLPQCDAVTYNYFVKNQRVFDSPDGDRTKIAKSLADFLNEGGTVFDFCFSENSSYVFSAATLQQLDISEIISLANSRLPKGKKINNIYCFGVPNAKAFRFKVE